jgi:hypothetical protein
MDNKGDESSVADIRRMMITMFNELKGDTLKQLKEYQDNVDKKLGKTETNELKQDFKNS